MPSQKPPKTVADSLALRQRAEEAMGLEPAPEPQAQQSLLHELRVHQIELELQNEELRRVQVDLVGSRAQYFDLYDLAPVGYCSVSETGRVLQANLTLATMLGMTRGALARESMARLILEEDQDIYYRMRYRLLAGPAGDAPLGEPATCELRLRRADGTPVWALVVATATQAPAQPGGAGRMPEMRVCCA